MAAVVPDGFPAYVRILHPARGAADRPVRWAEVAAWSGRKMHRLVQFHAIARPTAWTPRDPAPWDGEPPPDGNLPAELLGILCATLAGHTSTTDSCCFCLWDGYGWLYGSPLVGILGRRGSLPVPPAFPSKVLDGSRVRLPHQDSFLFAGPLAAARELGWASPGGGFFPQSPNLFWPRDQAWCVASEIDLYCTLIAGSEALAEALVADPRLEAWRVQPGDPIAFEVARPIPEQNPRSLTHRFLSGRTGQEFGHSVWVARNGPDHCRVRRGRRTSPARRTVRQRSPPPARRIALARANDRPLEPAPPAALRSYPLEQGSRGQYHCSIRGAFRPLGMMPFAS